MLRKIAVMLVVVCMCFGSVYAEDDYLYKDTCPTDQSMDKWSFYKCNCTSYAAYALNAYGISFNNSYRQTGGNYWSDAGKWNDAALRAGITVDNFPLPGDIVYWENMGNYGHVAEVVQVDYSSSTAWNKIFIKQYNGGNKHEYSEKWIYPSDNPSGFIHILAYEEGVSSLYYLDCYEQSSLCNFQTKEEWKMIADRVWNNYRCAHCQSNYNSQYISAIANNFIGKGGGPGTTTSTKENDNSTDLPDFVVSQVVLTDSQGNEKYQFYKNDKIKIKAILKNIGDTDINSDDNIETRYYLSQGYKEDNHNDWIRIGKDNTKGRNLDPGETHVEEDLKLWEYNNIQPNKTYNIVVCVDRTRDNHNGDGDYPEIHKSNNCSTEAIFQVLQEELSIKKLYLSE